MRSKQRLRAVSMTTQEYPGFATDLQAQYMAMMTQAEGTSVITETIFENRFMHAPELARMGADIRIEGRQAIVTGTNGRAQVKFSDGGLISLQPNTEFKIEIETVGGGIAAQYKAIVRCSALWLIDSLYTSDSSL